MTVHNAAEIEVGQLASERASNAEVKKYAQMMVNDHTMAGNELKQAVGGHVQVQEQTDQEHRDLLEKLRGMKGMEFDREYMNAMVEGHQEVKTLLEERAEHSTGTSGTATPGGSAVNDAELETAVNQWAAKTLPKVEQHLQQAEQLRERLRGRTTTENTTGTNRTTAGEARNH